MPIAKGVVTSCRKNRKGFQLDGEAWYSRMDGPAMDSLETWRTDGVTIEIEWFEKDGWKNFTKDPVVVQEEPEQQPAPSNRFGKPAKKTGGNSYSGGGYKKVWHAYEDKPYQEGINNRITRQNALNNAVSLVAASKIDEVGPDTVDLVTTVANLFVAWVEGGTE